MDYSAVKNELKKLVSSTRHFTKDFYNVYLKAIETGKRIDEAGKDDKYYKNGILLRHRFDEVYQSEFYNKNSCAYCEFLSIMCRA